MEDKKEFCETCKKEVWSLYLHKHCPQCDSAPENHELRNYDMMWHEGDIHCGKCGAFVRYYDAG